MKMYGTVAGHCLEQDQEQSKRRAATLTACEQEGDQQRQEHAKLHAKLHAPEAVVGIGNVQLTSNAKRVIPHNNMHRGTHASSATLNSKSELRWANIFSCNFEPSLSGQGLGPKWQ
eukprot:5915227-Amphidinium_carterae.1